MAKIWEFIEITLKNIILNEWGHGFLREMQYYLHNINGESDTT